MWREGSSTESPTVCLTLHCDLKPLSHRLQWPLYLFHHFTDEARKEEMICSGDQQLIHA